MTDLISRSALFNACANLHDKGEIFAAIQNAPSVDAVEVVRCKECKYGMNYEFCYGDNHFACCDMEDGIVHFAKSVNEDDFCSYGERR